MVSNDPVLEVQCLTITFPGQPVFTAVQDLTFSIQQGHTLAIVGESGSGKSLTALSLLGLLPVSANVSGRMVLHTSLENYELNKSHDDSSWQNVRGNGIGMIFQEPMSSLNPVMRVGRQLSEAILARQSVSKAEAKKLAIDWLAKVQLPEPEKMYRRYPHQLSGGQKQRVMIAMAMCNQPVLLVADEPTTALDVTVQMEIIRLMRELQQQTGTAMIFITHDLALATAIADEVLVMYRGEMVEYGPASRVLQHPEHPYTKALIACRPAPENKGGRLPVVADFMEVQEFPAIDNPIVSQPPPGDVLLRVEDLKVWFTEKNSVFGKPLSYYKAVDGVSFNLRRGEVLGLVGESGCGKSTLSRSLMGLLPVQQGSIIFDGTHVEGVSQSEWRRLRRHIQMIFQDPFASLNPRITVEDMLMEPLAVHGLVPRSELRKEASRLLDLVHLPSTALRRYPHQFSGGQRQRLGIARALALRPKLLICDESVSALDVSVQAQILNLLKELQATFGLSYLFISHDLAVVHYISDRVLVMQAGTIVEAGEAESILSRPTHPYTRRLIAAMPGLHP